jgi:hypothetical protein
LGSRNPGRRELRSLALGFPAVHFQCKTCDRR